MKPQAGFISWLPQLSQLGGEAVYHKVGSASLPGSVQLLGAPKRVLYQLSYIGVRSEINCPSAPGLHGTASIMPLGPWRRFGRIAWLARAAGMRANNAGRRADKKAGEQAGRQVGRPLQSGHSGRQASRLAGNSGWLVRAPRIVLSHFRSLPFMHWRFESQAAHINARLGSTTYMTLCPSG